MLDIHGSLHLLNCNHVRERDKALRWWVVSGTVFSLKKVGRHPTHCRFCGALRIGDGHLFWESTFPPLDEIRENPDFHDLMRMDKAIGQGAYSEMAGFQCFLVFMVLVPWAADASRGAGNMVENVRGSYSSGLITEWSVLEGFDPVEARCS